jgi:hypothetical protein
MTTVKRKHLFLAMVAVLAAGGIWLARVPRPAQPVEFANRRATSQTSNMDVGVKTPPDEPKPGQIRRPPDPTRRFTDFTPEQRVEFARKGHGPGG